LALATLIHGLAPVAREDARILVLGSMPGPASLAARQYYAHRQNLFWPLMGQACGFDAALPYARRCAALKAAGIALWDVIGSCRRAGAADAAIAGAIPNDLPGFVRRHPRLERVLCNGALAEQVWRQHFAGRLAATHPALVVLRVPSTSAANAAWSRERRLAAWLAALGR
jgi:hypoxanthine-DNA glycosylase